MFDIAEEFGFQFKLLDIGGGFPGQKSAKLTFEEVCIYVCYGSCREMKLLSLMKLNDE